MKKAKKLLSLILAVLMLYSGMSVGMTAMAVSVTGAVTYTSTDDVVICIPETIYMTPSTGASVSGQYFVNNIVDANGKVTLATDSADTTGQISIYAKGATKFSLNVTAAAGGIGEPGITYSDGTNKISVENTPFEMSNHFNFDGLLLDISGTGVSAGSTAVLCWEVTITFSDGHTGTYYAYSTLYSPYLYPIGSAILLEGRYYSNNKLFASSMAWVSGVHGFTNDPAANYYARTDTMVPLITAIGTGDNEDNPDTNWISSSAGTNTLSTATFRYNRVTGSSGKLGAIGVYRSPVANITIDTSRYTNFNQIPNLTVGYNFTDKENAGETYWYVSDYTSGDMTYMTDYSKIDNRSNVNDQAANYYSKTGATPFAGSVSSQSSVNTGAEYNGQWNRAVITTGTSNTYIFKTGTYTYRSYLTGKGAAYSINYIQVNGTNVDKSALRKLVLQGTSLNEKNYTPATWSAYQTALQNAALALGNPGNSSVDTSALTNAMNALQTTVTLNANGGTINGAATTSFNQTVGSAATYSYNVASYVPVRTGYTFKGWSTSSSATSGSTSTVSTGLKPTLYATWEEAKYTITFDNMLDVSAWNISPNTGTISDKTASGFTLTATSGTDTNTGWSYAIPVKPNTSYILTADVEYTPASSGGTYDMYFYPKTATGSGDTACVAEEGARKESNLYVSQSFSASVTKPKIGIKTSADTANVVIRFDANHSGSILKVSNVRLYEAGTVADGVSYHSSVTVSALGTYGDLPEPTRPGYSFAGWYNDADQGFWDNADVFITSDTVVYSRWTPNKYIVTFEKNLGDGTSVQTNYTPEDSVTVPTLTRAGYTLTGWNVTTADGNWSGTYNAGDVLTGMYGSAVLQAQWNVATYTVTYDANGGTCDQTSKSFTIDDAFTLPTPTKTGYTFGGWKVVDTDGNWSGDALKGNVSAMHGNAKLQAQWTPIPYAITFYDWDGKVLQQSDVAYDSQPTPPADPERPADNWYTYEFSAWNPVLETVTGAATYTATYKATLIPYTVTLDAGEGSVSGNTTINYDGTTTSVTLPDATRTGYTFTGWTVKTEVGSWTVGEAVTGEITLDKAWGNVTFVANYVANEYTVTYDINGGTISDSAAKSFVATYDSEIGYVLTSGDVSRTAYTFKGWNTKADGTGDWISEGMVWQYTDITTVYAQWEAIEYTISFTNRDLTYKKNEFVTPPTPITYTIEDDLSTLLPDTTVEGYDFNYWSTNNATGSWENSKKYATSDLKTGNYGSVTLFMFYTAKTFTVTWKNYDGTVLKTDSVYFGSTPSYEGETPVKAPDSQYSYTFAGWTPELSTVTGDTVYTAVYTETVRKYNVKFEGVSDNKYEYNAEYTVPEGPEKQADAQYTYVFDYWRNESTGDVVKPSEKYNVTDDVTFKPYYVEVVNQYTITWIVDGKETTTSVKYGDTPSYGSTPTKDKTAEYTYTFVDWSPAIAAVTGPATYTAQFSSTKNSYTVKFVDEDGTTVLDTQTLDYGETPVYAGNEPTKAADVQYTYTFAGWNPEINTVTGDVTYTAKYDKTLNEYTITFVDEDGTELQSGDWKYGDTPVYSGVTPTKTATVQYTYTFDGWTTAIADVTGDATYTVKYKATTNKYTITFVDEDGTEISSSEVEYGAMPTAPADPTKTGDVQYSYTFAGWTPEIVEVTGAATYKATYTQSINKYTIKFVNYDGTVIQSAEVEYGTVPAVPETNPTRDADVQYTYTFAGWDNTVVAVTGATTYTATYTSKVNQYKVTFVDWDDSVLATYTLDYGTMPTAPADPTRDATAEWTYTFDAWSPAISTVSGDITYKATYVETKNTYMITFVDDNGTELQSGLVSYGETPAYTAATPTKAATAQYTYTFAGWSPAVEAVTGTATYTATYDAEVNKYTVTFYNEDGSAVLDAQTLDYGAVPVYAGEKPVKGDAYDFSGWATSINGTVAPLTAITGNVDYYAIFVDTNREFTVKWYKEDGSLWDTKVVKYGTLASTLSLTDADDRASTAQYDFEFAGWNVVDNSETALDLTTYKITADTSFYPAYSKTVRSYTITFVDENGTTVLKSEDVEYGTVPSTPANPTKESTAKYSYTFSGWTPVVAPVTGEATYTATYTETINKYTIKFVDDDGSILKTENVAYGAVPTAPANPTKAATAQYTYTFDKWSPEIVTVTGEATYTATYTATVNEYTVKFVDEDGTVLQECEVAYGETPAYTGSTPAKTGDVQYSYTFKEWSPAIKAVDGVATYTATFTQSVNEYTIKFVNDDGTVLQESKVPYGTKPVYSGETPTKAATAQYTYTFNTWDTEVVEVKGDATYTATFSSTVNKYVIEFVNDNGEVLQSSEVAYGKTPVYTGATPTKTATAQYTYTFKDWDKEIVAVTGVATYTATYDSTVNKYTITFKNEDGTVLQQSEWEYGSTPSYTGATPAKPGTAKYTYTFKDWGTIEKVTEAAIYVAKYTETINKYTITFVNEDGTVLQSTQVEYDAMPGYTGATPEKEATAQYTYTFDKWSPEIVTVTEDATYTATYTPTVNEYTITWVTGAGTYTGEWKYGSTPVPATDNVDTSKASTVSTDFAFAGWDIEIAEVTGTATYTALYTESIRKYTITWIVDGESTTADVGYGTVPVFEGTPVKESTVQYEYTFTSWDVTPVAVVGEATYTAVFAETVRKYTITWITGSGEYKCSWEYGSTPDPVVDNVNTSKAPTPEAEYSFTGWNKAISTVTGEATYIAQYDETIRSYNVKYVVDGVVVEEQTIKFGSNFAHPEIPAKEGHSSHWDVGFMTMPAQDITVTAVYTAKKYTVTWVADGITVYEEQIVYATAIPSKAVPVLPGRTGVWDMIPETMPAENIVITAVYTPNSYSVSWNFTYGSGTDVATYGDDYEVTFAVAILPVYVRVTIGGSVLSDEYYSYDNESGKLVIVGTAIIGAISISERAAEGYQNVIVAVSNATLSNSSTIVAEGQAYHTQIIPADGYLLPEFVTVYINGIELYEGYSYDANTGRLTVNADVMIGELAISVDCPANPNYDPAVKDCDCSCHGNSFVRFFWSIINMLRKLFGMTQHQYCACGDAHW